MDRPLPDELRERAAKVRLLILDVDGVLTDGTLYYGADGETLKAFHVRDGLGIKLLAQEHIAVAVITAKSGGPLSRRLRDLDIEHVHMGREDKRAALDDLLSTIGCGLDETAYVGDDLVDLPVMRVVGLPITVADGHAMAKAAAAWVTQRGGGRGAVREIADALLDARGRSEAAAAAYLERHRKASLGEDG